MFIDAIVLEILYPQGAKKFGSLRRGTNLAL